MSHLPVPQGSLAAYLAEINRFPILSADEEFRLAVRYRDEGDVEAAHKLVVSNLRFVVKIAHEYGSYGFRLTDLIQEGNVGLMQAVKKFDPHKGFRLLSYAVWWIRAAIRNFVLRSWSLVKMGTTRAQRKLFHKGLFPARDLSLDEPLSDESPTTHLDLVPSSNNQEDQLADRQEKTILRAEVGRVLKKLNERERFIVQNRLMTDEPATLQEIGNRFRITRERARQIEKQVKGKIRASLLPRLQPSPAAS